MKANSFKNLDIETKDGLSLKGNVVSIDSYQSLRFINEVIEQCRQNIQSAVREYQTEVNDAISDFYRDVAKSIE